ncbi:type II toxin-antitoxin system VapC family toxin [Vulcanisaeta distributa]|uniref:type II toxin-antitoxin system VapC family toxin n=1 Tax=Vulcanisaeta distributa TaxID=164451 RepID=UPI000A52AC35|nr:type II toxin-antitoxin system VapC family toxin [Vulcanisaeta distributa]
MSYLFDASSIMNIIKHMKRGALSILRGNYVLDLTMYEIGNALWKDVTLFRILTENEAVITYRDILEILNRMNVIKPSNAEAILKLAVRANLTYYDASYVVTASEKGLVLVTDDEVLIKRINDKRREIREIFGREVTIKTSKDFMD